MTLLIAFLLLAQIDASPLAYVGTFVLWLFHVGVVSSPSADSIAKKVREHVGVSF